ncbi:GNAT family N-acetyltransferase [Streptomyces sp. NPDC059989]|uniref:GNAT family N-acetyltransferase n=1 Tax=Streptomyces sp. NPDC059989 TaxID=3347026 RepID=UPI0036B60769
MQSITIRRATGQDADGLTALMQESDAYRGQYATVIADYRVTAGYIDRHQVFAAVDTTDRILGFYALVLEPAELDLAFVSDEAQGAGVGRLLVEHMIDQARGAGLDYVRVVSHPPAEQFYRRLGAERVGSVPPSPPKVTWERPELRFVIGDRSAAHTRDTATP